eukprot:c23252_g1_i1 orf=313-744(-)
MGTANTQKMGFPLKNARSTISGYCDNGESGLQFILLEQSLGELEPSRSIWRNSLLFWQKRKKPRRFYKCGNSMQLPRTRHTPLSSECHSKKAHSKLIYSSGFSHIRSNRSSSGPFSGFTATIPYMQLIHIPRVSSRAPVYMVT